MQITRQKIKFDLLEKPHELFDGLYHTILKSDPIEILDKKYRVSARLPIEDDSYGDYSYFAFAALTPDLRVAKNLALIKGIANVRYMYEMIGIGSIANTNGRFNFFRFNNIEIVAYCIKWLIENHCAALAQTGHKYPDDYQFNTALGQDIFINRSPEFTGNVFKNGFQQQQQQVQQDRNRLHEFDLADTQDDDIFCESIMYDEEHLLDE